MDVRVVVICSDELEIITVDGIEMEDLSSIRNKPIKDWFVPSHGRDGWEGLIREIKKMIDDDEANLNFEFQGPKESKCIFEKMLSEHGYGTDANGLSIDEIAKINLEEAQKAEHRGLYKKALTHYVKAAEFGKSAEALFCVAEYYFNFEDKGIDCDEEEAITNAIEYYEKAASVGHIMSQYRLYEILSTNLYVTEDREKALAWLKKAAESGDDNAQVELGDEYAWDEDSKGFQKAVKWYRKAADKKNDIAYLRIAECYRWGNGVPKDQKRRLNGMKKLQKKEM